MQGKGERSGKKREDEEPRLCQSVEAACACVKDLGTKPKRRSTAFFHFFSFSLLSHHIRVSLLFHFFSSSFSCFCARDHVTLSSISLLADQNNVFIHPHPHHHHHHHRCLSLCHCVLSFCLSVNEEDEEDDEEDDKDEEGSILIFSSSITTSITASFRP